MERAVNLDLNMNGSWNGPKKEKSDSDNLYQMAEIMSEKQPMLN